MRTDPRWQLVHDVERSVDVRFDGELLFRYVYRDEVPANETPKPFFHPLNTLAGDTTTLYRPHDHPWHTGLTMTIPQVGEANFWGGNSYVPGDGYIQLPNNGEITHSAWTALAVQPSGIDLVEELSWVAIDSETLLEETREISVHRADAAAGWYALDLKFSLRNIAGRPLELGSSASKGFAGMGYWGMHWRGIRSFAPGALRAPGDLSAEADINGNAFDWVAYTGVHDENEHASTLIFVDRPRSERFPTQWFAKADTFPSITASFVYENAYELDTAETLTLEHRVIVATGNRSEREILDIVESADAAPDENLHAG